MKDKNKELINKELINKRQTLNEIIKKDQEEVLNLENDIHNLNFKIKEQKVNNKNLQKLNELTEKK